MSADHGWGTDMTRLAFERASGWCFGRVSRPFPMLWTHSCQAPAQTFAHHPQIGQHKQRLQMLRVLGQAAVAHLHMTELAFDGTEWVLHLGSDACLYALDLIGQRILGSALSSSMRKPGRMATCPLNIVFDVGPLVRPLVPGVGKDICLLPMQQVALFRSSRQRLSCWIDDPCRARASRCQQRHLVPPAATCHRTVGTPLLQDMVLRARPRDVYSRRDAQLTSMPLVVAASSGCWWQVA